MLHDEVGQLLTAAGLQLDVLRLDFGGQTPGLAQRTAEIQDLLEAAMAHVRDLSTDAHPNVVKRIGLRSALDRIAAQARLRGISLTVDISPGLQIPEAAAADFLAIATRSLAYSEYRGARNISLRVFQTTDAYVLEVLYDVASPNTLEILTRPGTPVSVTSDPCGSTTIRAEYSNALRGPAG